MPTLIEALNAISERTRHLEGVEWPQIGDGEPSHFAAEGVQYWDYTDDALYVNNDGLNGWTFIGGTIPPGVPHAILSTTHTDATAATVVRGDLITGQDTAGVTTWQRLPLGVGNTVLMSDGLDAYWGMLAPWHAPHDLLSATHTDTVVNAVTRGSIVYGNATPAWDELVIGANGTYLRSDGTDPAWSAIQLADLPAHNLLSATHGDTVVSAATQGDLVVGTAGGWDDLGIGGAGTYLRSDGADPSWQAIQAADIAHDLLSATHSDTVASVMTRGDLVVGTAGGWDDLGIGGAGTFLRSDGNDPSWQALVVGDIPAHDLLSATHGDTVPCGPTRGDLIVGTAVGWNDLAHPGAAGYAFTTDANDVLWTLTPTWLGRHVFAAGADLDDGSGDSPTLRFIGGTNDDTALIFLDEDATATDSDLVVRLCDAAGDSQLIIQDSGGNSWFYVDSDGNFDAYGHGAIGDSATVSVDFGLNIGEIYTDNAGSKYGIWCRTEAEPTANFATFFYGVMGQARLDTAQTQTSGYLCGVEGVARVNNSIAATVNRLIGGYFHVDGEDATLVSQAEGVLVHTPDVDTGAITAGYGIHIMEGTIGGGSITTLYGLYIDSITTGGTNYAIYTNTGSVRLGDTINYAGAMGDSGKDPTTDAPDDWVECEIAGVTRYLPAYAVA